jgi:hypothetical protein
MLKPSDAGERAVVNAANNPRAGEIGEIVSFHCYPDTGEVAAVYMVFDDGDSSMHRPQDVLVLREPPEENDESV